MKNKSRTSIAVVAVAALGCGAAQAAVLTIGPGGTHTYSLQGQTLSPTTAVQRLPGIVVTLGADYSVNDNITLRIVGATVGGTTDANLGNVAAIVCEEPGVPAPDADPTNDPIVVSFITRNGNDILLRVTQKNVVNTVGDRCWVGNPSVANPNIQEPIQGTQASLSTLTTVTASWNATTAITNIAFDAGNTLTIASVIDQFVTTPILALNGIVDVNDPSLRRSFTTSDFGIWGTDDAFIVDTLDRAGLITAGPVATLTTVFATLIGDVSFIDNDNDGCETTDLTSGAGRVNPFENGFGSGVPGVAANCGNVTWDYTPGAAGETVRHWLIPGNDRTVAGARVLTAPQQFTATVRYDYSLGAATGTETDGPVAAGEWKLNGFSAFVPYMPYAAGISQIIYLTNKSGQSGTITVDAYNQAGVACNFTAGTMQASRVTVLTGAVKAGLEGCYGAGFDDRVSMTVVANIPAGRAELVTAYNVNGDRVQVINTSNGRITQGGNSTTGGQL
jgi:hypothetical protein